MRQPTTCEQSAYEELQCYTLAHRDPAFIHQHVVDAFAAQHADEETKPITLTFALIGLCLHVDYGFSGGQVQRAHMALARHRRGWPSLQLPVDRGVLTVADVVVRPEGQARDEAIDRWCASVWTAYKETHPAVVALLREHGVL
jgi:hypothetical protein